MERRVNWLPLLSEALAKEYGTAPWVGMFATTDRDCTPHLRTVVIRLIDEAGRLHVASDGRSRKNQQAKENPAGAVAVWLPGLRTQFRVEGTVDVVGPGTIDQAVRQRIWRGLSDATRATYDWPEPGGPRPESTPSERADLFPAARSADAPISDAFELIRIHPRMVERLLLTEHPHARVRWRIPEWKEESINP